MQRDNLDLLRALEADEAAARRRALWTSSAVVVAAAAILGVLLFTAYRQLADVRAQTRQEEQRLAVLRKQNDSLQLLANNYQEIESQWVTRRLDSLPMADDDRLWGDDTAAVYTQMMGRPDTSGRVPTRPSFSPKAQAPAPDESGTYVTPPPEQQRVDRIQSRVYLQILVEEDRGYAERVGRELEERGFRVLGVEHVRRSARLRNTELRYYKQADADGARRLLEAMHGVGEDSTALLYLGLENNTRVRPRHYEIWFAPGAAQAAARRANAPRAP